MKKLKLIIVIILVIIIFIIILIQTNLLRTIKINRNEWKTKEENLNGSYVSIENNSNENTIKTIEYLKNIYNIKKHICIENENIEKQIESAIAYDTYNNTINYTIFKINNFSEKCIIAVQFEGDTNYYLYSNSEYRPTTIKEFIDDYNLKETVLLKNIYYCYDYLDSKFNKKTKRIEFYNVDSQIMWQTLFYDESLENRYYDSKAYNDYFFKEYMNISVEIPTLNIKNQIALTLNNGYLIIYLWNSCDNIFYIGKEQMNIFIDYIIENYEGYYVK